MSESLDMIQGTFIVKSRAVNLSSVITDRVSWPFAKNEHLTPLDQLHALSWPAGKVAEGVRALAIKSGLIKQDGGRTKEFSSQQSVSRVLEIDQIAQQWGIEAESVSVSYNDLESMLQRSGPTLFRLPARSQHEHEARFVSVIKGGRWWLSILGSDMSVHRIKLSTMRSALCTAQEAPLRPVILDLFASSEEKTTLSPKELEKVRDALLRKRLKQAQIKGCWLLRLSPNDSFFKQSLRIGFINDLGRFIFTQAAQEVLRFLTVGLFAQAAISGQIEWGMLAAALLIWGSRAPLTLTRTWSEALLSTKIGILLKQRLFYGALQLDLDLVEKTGTGQFLAWVLESETIEGAGVGGGIFVLQTAITLVVMTLLLTIFAGPGLGFSLFAWLLFSFFLVWRMTGRYRELNESYSDMTNDLLEWLQGHQTRLVQEQNWHGEADEAMGHYISIFQKYASQLSWYVTLIPAGWQLLIMGGLAIELVSGSSANSPLVFGVYFLALSLGFQYIQGMTQGSPELVRAIAAWQLIAPIQQAATITPEAVQPIPVPANIGGTLKSKSASSSDEMGTSNWEEASTGIEGAEASDQRPLILDAQNILFRYHERGRAILDHLDLIIRQGDQLLLEGPSGGGKSTLATVLTGLNPAESGLLLLHGLDRHTIGGMKWRKRVVYAPQFHQNHVLSASLAFNLLMGRRWPASTADLLEAETLCRELGLGDLIDRMPQGVHEPVGKRGWQLSHGERSRLYIARALLQQADLVILDESFASLDPESIEIALRCVLRRAPTLIVIAHP